ncbi:MAG: FtsX-like permease family protein [Clostridiales bacterium]|nr:FtsX-like permease family protein [Clostridiales bacterium]
MFSKLVLRNTKRSQKENLLFMSSLVISIIAFYVVLSLKNQDIVRYIQSLESDAINKLLTMVTALYMFTLVVLFFLIYYASKYQIERRSHELGVYLMMGMKRSKMFFMLLAEDIASSAIALVIGLPFALLFSELMSLITVKCVGVGFLEHQSTFDARALGLTLLGFVAIKLVSFFLISFSLFRKEVGALLSDAPNNIKKRRTPALYLASTVIGLGLLVAAYYLVIKGYSWMDLKFMLLTVMVGLAGTFMLFWGIRFFIGLIARRNSSKKLHAFTFRQIEDTVIFRSGTMALCSLLVLTSFVCMGAGISVFTSYDLYRGHVMDYTFRCDSPLTEEEIEEYKEVYGEEPILNTSESVTDYLKEIGVADKFSFIDVLRIGHVKLPEDATSFDVYNMDNAMEILSKFNGEFYYADRIYDINPHLISLGDYNKILALAGKEPLVLGSGELGVYMDGDVSNEKVVEDFNKVLAERPQVSLVGEDYVLVGEVYTTPIVTDYLMSPAFCLIIPDDKFDELAQNNYTAYLNARLDEDKYTNGNIFQTLTEVNDAIDSSIPQYLEYESYMNNMGRQLFYLVATSYVTIYLALVFLVIANTILGVQFLMNQKKSSKRYKTLIKLGAGHKTLCKSSAKQINWYFGIPIAVAAMSSIFGVRGLFSGILSSRTKTSISEMMITTAIVITAFVLIECIYILVVKRASFKYLKTLMNPEREE